MNFPAVALCVWACAQATAAVPHPISPKEEQQQQQSVQVTEVLTPSHRNLLVASISTSTTTTTVTTEIAAFVTCTKTVANIAPCASGRSLPLAKPAQPDIKMHMTDSPLVSSTDKESHLEARQLLLSSYVDADCLVNKGRLLDFTNLFIITTTTTTTSTVTETTKTNDQTTVSITYDGCIPPDAPVFAEECV